MFTFMRLYYQFFPLCLKGNVSQTFESSGCKNIFPSVYVIGKVCFGECFSSDVIKWGHYFCTNSSFARGFLQPPCCVFWNKCFERGPYLVSVISTVTPKLMPKLQTKASSFWIFLTSFVFENVFYTSLFV